MVQTGIIYVQMRVACNVLLYSTMSVAFHFSSGGRFLSARWVVALMNEPSAATCVAVPRNR